MAIQIGQTARVKGKLSPWYGLNCTVIGFVGSLAKVIFEGKYYRDEQGDRRYQEFLITIDDLEPSTGSSVEIKPIQPNNTTSSVALPASSLLFRDLDNSSSAHCSVNRFLLLGI